MDVKDSQSLVPRAGCFVQHPQRILPMVWCWFAAGLVSSYSPRGLFALSWWEDLMSSGTEVRECLEEPEQTGPVVLYRYRWGSYCFLLGACFCVIIFHWAASYFILLWFIVCSLLSTSRAFFDLSLSFSSHHGCSVFYAFLQYLPVFLCIFRFLFCLPHVFFQLQKTQLIVSWVKPLRPVKTSGWSHLASLRVIMKCADMLICTTPTLLIKTQYWLPFIRLIMKYQYHLPSPSASVNRSSNECVSLQTHLDPVTYINLEIAPDGCRKLIGLSFDGRFRLRSGKEKWLEQSQQVELSHSRGCGWCIISCMVISLIRGQLCVYGPSNAHKHIRYRSSE